MTELAKPAKSFFLRVRLDFDLWGNLTWKIRYFGKFACGLHLAHFPLGCFTPLWCFMFGKNLVLIGVRYRYLGLHSVEFIWSCKLLGIVKCLLMSEITWRHIDKPWLWDVMVVCIMTWCHDVKCLSAISINISIRELHQPNSFDHIRCWWVLHMPNDHGIIMQMITAYADDYFTCKWLRHMQMITWYQSCPRVGWTRRFGSGRVGSRFCRILAGRVESGQHFGFSSFYWLFLGTWIYMNLRILQSDWLIFINIYYEIII